MRYVTLRSTCNRMLGLISSMATGLSTNALFCLYKSLVLPILECGLPVWNLHVPKNWQMTWRGYKEEHHVLS